MNHSDTLTKIAPALVAALAHIGGAKKGKVNPAFKSRYADLESVIAASKEILAENGLTLVQLPGACVGGILNLETIFMHESGEWISGEMGIALGKTDPQGVGSALSYARRYAQMSALNMPAVDDDGERGMGRVNGAAAPAEPQPIASHMGRKSSAQATRDGDHTAYIAKIDAATAEGLDDLEHTFDQDTATMPRSWLDPMRDKIILRREELAGEGNVRADQAAMDASFRETVAA